MASILDEISPSYIGEDRIVLTLSAATPIPRAFQAVEVQVDYSKTQPNFVELPLELTITPPSLNQFSRRIFRRNVPSTVAFTPKEGGPHLVRIAEVGHNKWWGRLVVNVLGERLDLRRAV